MEIKHIRNDNMFVAYDDDGSRAGTIEYSAKHDGNLYATHTWTDPQFRGQGVAAKLLDALVEYAVAQQVKIIPICSYVRRAFQDHPDKYATVTADDTH